VVIRRVAVIDIDHMEYGFAVDSVIERLYD
jgi:hypothetical protein